MLPTVAVVRRSSRRKRAGHANHVASNEAFLLVKAFTDPRLCAAIVDRLTYNGPIIETGTTSYRLAHARAAKINT